jgi:hypothetical protein
MMINKTEKPRIDVRKRFETTRHGLDVEMVAIAGWETENKSYE